MRALVLTVALAATLCTQAFAGSSPTALMNTSLEAAMKQRSVHYTGSNSSGYGDRFSYRGDVGRTRGVQWITLERGGVTGRVEIRVVGGNAYVRANAPGLNIVIGFRETPSKTYAGRWIRIPPGNSAFRNVAAGVTLPTEINGLRLVSARSAFEGAVGGEKQIVIFGTTNRSALDQARLVLRGNGTPLPVSEVVPEYSGPTFRTSLSHWNEKVTVTVPPHAVDVRKTGLE